MHTWHGSVVTPGAMIASSLDYSFYKNKFTVGLWGGASFNGEYTEFSYYLEYRITNKLKASLISHNNYSSREDPNIFSWNKYSSPNFLDIVIESPVSEDFPLYLYFSTILFGQGGDFETDPHTQEVKNSFSNYVELRYPLFPEDRLKFSLFAGGAFSLFTYKTFYTQNENLVNLGVAFQKEISVLKYSNEVTAKAFWNPESERAGLEIDFSLL